MFSFYGWSQKKYLQIAMPTPKNEICCANEKFSLCYNRPKKVLRTDVFSQEILSVVSKNSRLVRQQAKSVMTTDLSVKVTDKTVQRPFSGRLEHY
jgi:hypothetical protein